MPTINIFYQDKTEHNELNQIAGNLRPYVAKKLSTKEKQLSVEEISVRLVRVEGESMIGKMELEITAHAFQERVERQDEICNEIRQYIQESYPSIGEVRVWLILCELGHSW